MGGTGLLIRRVVRKHWPLLCIVTVLSVVSGLLAGVALQLLTKHSAAIDAQRRAWHAPELMVVVPTAPGATEFRQHLAADPRVSRLESLPVVILHNSAYRNGEKFGEAFVVEAVDGRQQLGQRTVVAELAHPVPQPAWVSRVFQDVGGYQLGDEVTITADGARHSFHIQGFVEDTYGGVPGISTYWIWVPAADLAALQERVGTADSPQDKAFTGEAWQVAAANPTEANSAQVEAERAALQAARLPASTELAVFTTDLGLLEEAVRAPMAIISLTLLSFAALVLLVLVVVLSFMLRNAIVRDLPQVGVLRAMGFGVWQVMVSCMAPFVLLGAGGALLGGVLAAPALGKLQPLLRAQTGITWRPQSAVPLVLGVAAVLTLVVLATGLLVAWRLRRTPVVAALRGGTSDHAFRRTWLPLERTRGPLAPLLGIKAAGQAAGRSSAVLLITAIAAFTGVFLSSLASTLGNGDSAIRLLVGDVEDVNVDVKPEGDLEEVLRTSRQLPGVRDGYLMEYRRGDLGDIGGFYFLTDAYSQLGDGQLYAGRWPRHANEVALGTGLADHYGLAVGDVWTVEAAGQRADYVVTGIVSGVTQLGRFAYFPTAAFQRLDPAFEPRSVALQVTGDIDAVVGQIRDRYGDQVEATNRYALLVGSLKSYVQVVPVLAGTISAFTGTIVVLILSLVVSTVVVQSRLQLGIMKALGFAHREVASQVRWAVLPPVLVGSALGAGAGWWAFLPLLRALLRRLGLLKIDVASPTWPVWVVPLVLVVTSGLVAWLVTRRIKSISPYVLLAE